MQYLESSTISVINPLGDSGESKSEVTSEELTIPVIEERLRVDVQKRITGVVRLEKIVHEREETVHASLSSEIVSVERVPVNRYIDETPAIRYEGDTMIVPVVEEVLVSYKQLVLKEEVHVRRTRSEKLHEQTETVRSEEVRVSRVNQSSE